MKLSEFILLSEAEKQQAALHLGVLVAKRKLQNGILFLFRLEDYYVEMSCNTVNRRVTQYQVFTGSTLLEPYLSQISISRLLP
ncbi:hypothetical protein PDL71_04045 [Lacibacter sp. MH-610]|uniref:hypothetical protein n=1 Tax=Lacibacter sp. MH-610 TaxID=3020883 RepID=UPI003891D6DF